MRTRKSEIKPIGGRSEGSRDGNLPKMTLSIGSPGARRSAMGVPLMEHSRSEACTLSESERRPGVWRSRTFCTAYGGDVSTARPMAKTVACCTRSWIVLTTGRPASGRDALQSGTARGVCCTFELGKALLVGAPVNIPVDEAC